MHTRGRLAENANRVGVDGTTHAHAGQTLMSTTPGALWWNHPCTRGADADQPHDAETELEPPMHTRGRLINCFFKVSAVGTTHAHAGQTKTQPQSATRGWNHPCTRGADRTSCGCTAWVGEPPMHTRGRRVHTERCCLLDGTTHAHAGQTCDLSLILTGLRNHPCTRGADVVAGRRGLGLWEPPMHTRGRLP